jgi:hypothetical protein
LKYTHSIASKDRSERADYPSAGLSS